MSLHFLAYTLTVPDIIARLMLVALDTLEKCIMTDLNEEMNNSLEPRSP
jgi:hypothetical protein